MSTGILAGNLFAANVVQVTWDIPSVAANTSEEETFSLPGVKVGDFVHVAKSDLDAGIVFGSSRVSADGTVAVQIVNTTAAPVNAAEETVQVMVLRPAGNPSEQTKIIT